MSIDTPARIAILGAGPTGIEAALYARYLGYQVFVYDEAEVCHQLLAAGDLQLPVSAGPLRTPLGLAALQAQFTHAPPGDSAGPETARSLAETYFLPLAKSDLLLDAIFAGHGVARIERTEFPEIAGETPLETVEAASTTAELVADEAGETYDEIEYAPFELFLERADGFGFSQLAEVVIDTRGTSNRPELASRTLQFSDASASDARQATIEPFRTAEPNFYALGFDPAVTTAAALSVAHDQIRQLFAVIGGRATLNLYDTHLYATRPPR